MDQRNKINLATAKAVPIFLAVLVVYISYAVTGPLAVGFLLNPPHGVPARDGAGITIPIVYYLLLIPVATAYLRLLIVIFRDPGYIPTGAAPKSPDTEPAGGLEEFWKRNVFTCDAGGQPIWCAYCNNWKPDRTHHSQDAGRCTRKMDHFCPWVGGVVGERSYKFFIQFNFYSFWLAAYTLSVLAYFVAEDKEDSNLKVQWIIALGLSAFFCLFTCGIFCNSVWMTLRNVTSIENVDSVSHIMTLAVLLPPALQDQNIKGPPPPPQAYLAPEVSSTRSGEDGRPLTSDLDDPSHSSYFLNMHSSRAVRRSSALPHQHQIWKGTVTYPLHLQTDRPPLPAPPPRTFAILQTLPGMNPWDLGTPLQNFQAVFGKSLHEWLLPIRHSPCCDHSSLTSQFPLGPDFEELLVEAGLAPRPTVTASQPQPQSESRWSQSSRKPRRKPRLEPGWQNGERPDGWISEKEARRLRNEARRSTHDEPPPGVNAFHMDR